MSEKVNANFKISLNDKQFLENLVATKTYPSLSQIYRTAVNEFIAKYTNRPTLLSLDRQIRTLQSRKNRQEEEMRNIRRKQAELEAAIEELKKNGRN